MNVTSPGSGDELEGGSTETVTWTATDNVGVVSRAIYFSSDNGSTWTEVDSAAGNTGSFQWDVPNISADNCLIKIFAYDAAGNVGNDESGTFSIGPTGIIPHGFTVTPTQTYKVTVRNIQGREIASFKASDMRQINEITKNLSFGVQIIHIVTPDKKTINTIRINR